MHVYRSGTETRRDFSPVLTAPLPFLAVSTLGARCVDVRGKATDRSAHGASESPNGSPSKLDVMVSSEVVMRKD